MAKIQSVAKGSYRDGENDDCFVRALSNVTGKDYDEVHSVCKSFGRKDCEGTPVEIVSYILKHYGFDGCILGKTKKAFGLTYWMDYYHDKSVSITLKTACKDLSIGRYIVLVDRHALAVVDGGIVDLFDNKERIMVHGIFWLPENFASLNNTP